MGRAGKFLALDQDGGFCMADMSAPGTVRFVKFGPANAREPVDLPVATWVAPEIEVKP